MVGKKILVLIIILLIAYFSLGSVIAYRLTHIERSPLTQNPQDLGLYYSEVTFTSEDGISLSGWQIEPSVNKSTIITFVHGIGVNRAQHHHLELAKHLNDREIASLLFDLRGHGLSGGELVSGGYFEQQDVISASKQNPDYSCRVLFGSSLGGAAAILAAEKLEPEIDGVIVDSSYADISDLIAGEIAVTFSIPPQLAGTLVPGASVMARLIYGIDLSTLVPAHVISNLPYPVLIIHGDQDTRISVEQAIKLYAKAPQGSELLVIENAGHTAPYVTAPAEYLTAVDQYIDEVCK